MGMRRRGYCPRWRLTPATRSAQQGNYGIVSPGKLRLISMRACRQLCIGGCWHNSAFRAVHAISAVSGSRKTSIQALQIEHSMIASLSGSSGIKVLSASPSAP
jgi:hypothetical protein